jgi:hypothetical protein
MDYYDETIGYYKTGLAKRLVEQHHVNEKMPAVAIELFNKLKTALAASGLIPNDVVSSERIPYLLG